MAPRAVQFLMWIPGREKLLKYGLAGVSQTSTGSWGRKAKQRCFQNRGLSFNTGTSQGRRKMTLRGRGKGLGLGGKISIGECLKQLGCSQVRGDSGGRHKSQKAVADREHFAQTASSLKARRHVGQDVAQQHTNGVAGDFHLSHVTHSSVLTSGVISFII